MVCFSPVISDDGNGFYNQESIAFVALYMHTFWTL